ncbi:MAG: plasmid pRiA4b ORF-3 family protein, partial [Nitrososphaerales archaeon]
FPPDKSVRYPVCVAGAHACPPEDVGGIPGYENFLQALADANYPEHDEYLEWIGGDFDPEKFDLVEVNHILRSVK